MVLKTDASPLKIRRFNAPKQKTRHTSKPKKFAIYSTDRRIAKGLQEIATAPVGSRWHTVRKVAYTLGGIPGAALDAFTDVINNSTQYSGYEAHCITCAAAAFEAGKKTPLTI
jgi:hypothetical protein